MAERTDYVLGRDVTEQARSQESRATSIVSLPLSTEEMDALCAVADQEGSISPKWCAIPCVSNLRSRRVKQAVTPAP